MNASAAIEALHVSCHRPGEAALRDVSLACNAGTFTALTGDARGGKELLLRVLGLLEMPESGEILLDGSPMGSLSGDAREELRNVRFGYVFAAPFLLPTFTVVENVAMPLFRISQLEPAQARVRSEELLEFIGLGGAAQEPVDALDAAAQRRVSLARALAHQPSVLIVEALDAELAGEESGEFAALLPRVCAQFGATVVATAARAATSGRADRIVEVAEGAVRRDSKLAGEVGA